MACLGVAAVAAIAAPALAAASEVRVTVSERDGRYRVSGGFATAAPCSLAWSVLTDYEHIGDFVHSIRRSTLTREPDGSRRLQQESIAGVFPFRRRMQVDLELREEAGRKIDFHDRLGRDFRFYAGGWALAADSAGTRVDYTLEASPRTRMPGAFTRGMLSAKVRDLLDEVRAEMEARRGGGASR